MTKAFDRLSVALEEAASLNPAITDFVADSNRIEGIYSVKSSEISATEVFLATETMSFEAIQTLQAAYAPGKPIRDRVGMNVRVGNYVAPLGGRNIILGLMSLVSKLNKAKAGINDNPWHTHIEFERLHPFLDGNGRTGRAVWAWHMQKLGLNPFGLPFLHRFYYQTLENDTNRK